VAELKRQNPLADVAMELGVDLRRCGRSLVGLCPFHDDRHDPNFNVYPDDRWHCYACGQDGDVIEFLKLKLDLDFKAACEWLSERSASGRGPVLPASSKPPRPLRRWDALDPEQQTILNFTWETYRNSLWASRRVLNYVRSRGIPDWLIDGAGLGYSDGHSLETVLRKGKYLVRAEEMGLYWRLERPDGSNPWREHFRYRLVIPELRHGRAIWFIGRRVPRPDGTCREDLKYLSLPGERPLLGWERALGKRQVIVCEGALDYLSALSWGLPAVAVCGTGFPANRLGCLDAARAVYGAFDPDAGGRQASQYFTDLFGHRFRPVQLPEGLDLNDLACTSGGREHFMELLRQAGWKPDLKEVA
jgi:DNA primase